jgi:dienelactone hydrolase
MRLAQGDAAGRAGVAICSGIELRSITLRARMPNARRAAVALVAMLAAGSGCGGGGRAHVATEHRSPPHASAPARAAAPARPLPRPPFPVGLRVVRLVDRSRTLPGGRGPRVLVTYVRYPAAAPRPGGDLPVAPPQPAGAPYPLVVFGHGFALTPAPYAKLLRAWASAGYVVAAPVFPLENADAPNGPDESDLVNQPRDMSFVISALTAPGGPLHGLVDPRRVAVAGHSDGGETALAVAYDRYYLDRRVRAAMILSGAKIPGVGGFTFPAPSPPLLATQGTADTVNPPSFTHAFYDIAPPPKYLLTLFGAEHVPPYSDAEPQLGVVGRVTTAFLDLYLKRLAGAERRLVAAGNVRGVSALDANR